MGLFWKGVEELEVESFIASEDIGFATKRDKLLFSAISLFLDIGHFILVTLMTPFHGLGGKLIKSGGVSFPV